LRQTIVMIERLDQPICRVWPIESWVESTPGFSDATRVDEIPRRAAIAPKSSPSCTTYDEPDDAVADEDLVDEVDEVDADEVDADDAVPELERLLDVLTDNGRVCWTVSYMGARFTPRVGSSMSTALPGPQRRLGPASRAGAATVTASAAIASGAAAIAGDGAASRAWACIET
jgi:hypothetical protein